MPAASPSRPPSPTRRRALGALGVAALACADAPAWAQMTPQWRATAQTVAARGVPLEALAPNAPDRYVVKSGDTLWDIAGVFLRSPWRWPELWGMNLEEVRNPHLIYPGQELVLSREGGRAVLRMGGAGALPTVVLGPRVRETLLLPGGAVATLPLSRIGPFLNQAVVLEANALEAAPRIVAAPDGRVLIGRGDLAYVRGALGDARRFAVYREPRPLKDLDDPRRVLGWEAAFVGTAELRALGSDDGALPALPPAPDTAPLPFPASVRITSLRQEAGVGDRLAPPPEPELQAYVPRPPAQPVAGRVISIYGDALSAGQRQIVTLDRGRAAGLERGHVVAVWRSGVVRVDRTVPGRPQAMRLPDEREGLALVFRVFDQVAYALVMTATEPVRIGDRFSEPDPGSP